MSNRSGESGPPLISPVSLSFVIDGRFRRRAMGIAGVDLERGKAKTPSRCFVLLLLVAVGIGWPNDARALCGLDGAVRETLRGIVNPDAARTLSLDFRRENVCVVCHLAQFGGPRNELGNAINTLLTISDREDPVRQRDAGRRVQDIPVNPQTENSPTFGDLFQQGRFPTDFLVAPDSAITKDRARVSESLTFERARQLVQQTESQSRFGILQLSKTLEITLDVAEELAKFRGELLILGLESLPPDIAVALSKSQAARVWLHSITSVSAESAQALVDLRGHLVLTSLSELESVSLAEKLAARPGALSFPYLTSVSPEIAAALAKTEKSLTLAGLTDVAPEVQRRLAETVGTLSLPNLRNLDGLPLAKKLGAVCVLLPQVDSVSVEQVKRFAGIKGQGSFWGAVYLPVRVVTPEIARALVEVPIAINLTLVGNEPLADDVLRLLLRSRMKISMRDLEELTAEQVRIVASGLSSTKFRSGVVEFAPISFPKLQRLDSALLAEMLARATGFNFPSVKEISPEAAAALGVLPDAEYRGLKGAVLMGPSGNLSLPSLQELTPEVARLLLRKRWISISLPSVEDISLETVRSLARQTNRLTLGIRSMPVELAGAFTESPTEMTMGGVGFSFPYLTELTPEAAQILVSSLSKDIQEIGGGMKVSRSPKLSFGGDVSSTTLSPALATELAKYQGDLTIEGLGELRNDSAAALASFAGLNLRLSGPAVEKLSPQAAASLAKVAGVLQLPLRELDSVTLVERFARQITQTYAKVELVSQEAVPALSEAKPSFTLRALTVLDSPVLAKRLVADPSSGGITLPALQQLTPEAAEILATSSRSLYLGLVVIDSTEVAQALAKSKQKLQLPRLRAATAEVITILRNHQTIETPALDSLYILPATERQEAGSD